MPADFNSEEYLYTYIENTDLYLARLDAAMNHYRSNIVYEKCVQRAISDLLKNKYKLRCEREAAPCKGSRLKMDLSGENYIVEVKMDASNLHMTIAQLSHYAKKKPGTKHLFIAVHEEDSYGIDEVSECDEHFINLVPASQCAHAIDELLTLHKENPIT
jgi:hypothetical protein